MPMFLSLVGGLLFSGIGFAAFMVGKKNGSVRHMAVGGALMVYPYFIPGAVAMWLVGLGLTAALFLPDRG